MADAARKCLRLHQVCRVKTLGEPPQSTSPARRWLTENCTGSRKPTTNQLYLKAIAFVNGFNQLTPHEQLRDTGDLIWKLASQGFSTDHSSLTPSTD